ncbi:Retrovirus-related Pol polyprotein from transposon [Dictyocoela muelleri]|nr:Retrovirus-related Pol polyprotein from transposon [Dictyocoela muelleri]
MKFNQCQSRYSVVEKEAFSIFKSAIHFKPFIFGSHIKIFTDSINITYIKKLPSSRISFWILLILDFSYKLGHIKGENNQIADYLSRSCILSERSKNERFEILLFENLKRIVIENETSNKSKLGILNEFKHEFIKSAHKFFGHPGISKLYNTLKNIFTGYFRKEWRNFRKEWSDFRK